MMNKGGKYPKQLNYKFEQDNVTHFFSLNVKVRKMREINAIVCNCVIINFITDKISNYVLIIYSVKINKYIIQYIIKSYLKFFVYT